ncbi:hypothetical protein LI951_12090 [Enterococcus sp. BWT-B8]|uniref:hypothetical protein n=1 Tax=Enterococcus sp. BWT-B8 TaxID=2885157 RepID=UPI001E3412DA|nr:hypothetical protein [Enterococcus sp. BWT-B8]MCB5952809.1 hypothetical protein [Enterococcus sp. BWT-B8]
MLKHLQSHQEYLDTRLLLLGSVTPEALDEYDDLIQMFTHLNFDSAHSVLRELYSHTGRPALAQIEIFRAYILCAYLNISWEKLLDKLKKRAVFRAIIGIEFDRLPTLPSFYELSRRLMPTGEVATLRCKLGRKPTKKLKKNEKMPEKKEKRTTQIARLIRKGNFALNRPERFLQRLFKRISIDASVAAGLLSRDLTVSGDGTCVYTGASNYGRILCQCRKAGIFTCNCPRRYSDPLATWGWDSHKEQYYYGHTAYFLATYHKELQLDLPIYLRLVEARRHDSVTALVALAEFRALYPEFTLNAFLSDSASDNYETCHLLEEWKIPAIIALNKRLAGNFTYKELKVNADGIPICEGGLPMRFNWNDAQRKRTKWRCPAMVAKCVTCPLSEPCSSSPYGRTFYHQDG